MLLYFFFGGAGGGFGAGFGEFTWAGGLGSSGGALVGAAVEGACVLGEFMWMGGPGVAGGVSVATGADDPVGAVGGVSGVVAVLCGGALRIGGSLAPQPAVAKPIPMSAAPCVRRVRRSRR